MFKEIEDKYEPENADEHWDDYPGEHESFKPCDPRLEDH